MIDYICYAGAPLDRADTLRRDDRQVEELKHHPDARFLVLDELKVAMTRDGSDLFWARRSEIAEGPCVFLGLENGLPRFAVASSAAHLPAVTVDAYAAAASLMDARTAIIAAARSLLLWHQQHRFCTGCGHATHMTKGGWARHCQTCDKDYFPRVDPVVIMLPVLGEEVLIGRQPGFPPNFWSALAGFVEPGESLEEAVRREVREESGIRCGDVRYVASQPWPFASSLMMGVLTQALDADITIDIDELEAARWVSREEARAALRGEAAWTPPPPLAIGRYLLEAWTTGHAVL